VAGGDGVGEGDLEGPEADERAWGEGHAGDGDVVGGMEEDGRVFGRGGRLDADQRHEHLSEESGFHDVFAGVDVEAALDGMDEEASVGGRGEVLDAADDFEFGVFGGGEPAADVEVEVALGADAPAVVGDAPIVAEAGFGFLDGAIPVTGAGGFVEFVEVVGVVAVGAGQDEPAVGLAGVDVLEDEEFDIGGLFFGFGAEAALAGFHGFGFGRVAGALADVGGGGEGEKQESEREGEKRAHWGHYTGGCRSSG
jgi:hypothetical protein